MANTSIPADFSAPTPEERGEPLLEIVRILAQVAVKEYLDELGRVELDGQSLMEEKK